MFFALYNFAKNQVSDLIDLLKLKSYVIGNGLHFSGFDFGFGKGKKCVSPSSLSR